MEAIIFYKYQGVHLQSRFRALDLPINVCYAIPKEAVATVQWGKSRTGTDVLYITIPLGKAKGLDAPLPSEKPGFTPLGEMARQGPIEVLVKTLTYR